jgi:hypothetical protein
MNRSGNGWLDFKRGETFQTTDRVFLDGGSQNNQTLRPFSCAFIALISKREFLLARQLRRDEGGRDYVDEYCVVLRDVRSSLQMTERIFSQRFDWIQELSYSYKQSGFTPCFFTAILQLFKRIYNLFFCLLYAF